MRSTPLLIFLLAAATPSSTAGQSAEQQVVAVAEALFDAMRSKDVATLRRLMLPEARLVAIDETREPPSVTWSDREQFIERIAGMEVEILERMWSPTVAIDGNMATLWAPYDFHRAGTFSHCGTDALHMVQIGDAWTIAHITYNRRLEGCSGPS
jgi:hypothetical protein